VRNDEANFSRIKNVWGARTTIGGSTGKTFNFFELAQIGDENKKRLADQVVPGGKKQLVRKTER
jgi:hypothetical protein